MDMVSDSLISNNLSWYSMNGIINPLKKGIILNCNSWVNFISTSFFAGNSGITPIISSENSSFFIYSEVLQRIKSNISYVVIANGLSVPAQVIGNQPVRNHIHCTVIENNEVVAGTVKIERIV